MAVSYKKLWKVLIDRDMTKTQLRKESGISTGALAKLGKNENVNTEVLVKICKTLQCDLSDIMELTEEGKKNGRFYGFYLYDGVCLFMVAKDANGLDMSVLTVGVCEYGHTIEKWETVTEATMFQQGYKIKYCDICFDITDEEIIDKLPIPDGAGDCDDDGLIRSGDLAVLKLYLADNYMGTMGSGADFNKDNRIDAIDLSLLKLFLASAQ